MVAIGRALPGRGNTGLTDPRGTQSRSSIGPQDRPDPRTGLMPNRPPYVVTHPKSGEKVGSNHPWLLQNPEMQDHFDVDQQTGQLIQTSDPMMDQWGDLQAQQSEQMEALLGGIREDLQGHLEAQEGFYDAQTAMQLRRQELDRQNRLARLGEREEQVRAESDALRPYMERQMRRDMRRQATELADRGHHSIASGVRHRGIAELGEDQATARARFEQQVGGQLRDIEHQRHGLEQQSLTRTAEQLRQGAGRATERMLGPVEDALRTFGGG